MRKLAFYLLFGFALNLAYAQLYTSLSLFLGLQLQASELQIGLFFIGFFASAIGVNHWVSRRSDRHGQRPRWVLCSLLSTGVAAAALTQVTTFNQALLVGTVLFSFTTLAMSEMFAMAREGQYEFGVRITLVNALIRASVSMGWIAGPPVGFGLAKALGYQSYFLLLAGMYLLLALLMLACMGLGFVRGGPPARTPDTTRQSSARSGETQESGVGSGETQASSVGSGAGPGSGSVGAVGASGAVPRYILIGVGLMALVLGANQAYVIALPHLLETRQLDPHWAGMLFGITALLEIPVIVLTGMVAGQQSTLRWFLVSVLVGMVFYTALALSRSLPVLAGIQALNALFMGIIFALGVTWVQDQLPDRPGRASALFINANQVGNILGGTGVILAGTLGGYGLVPWINAAAVTLVAASLLLATWKWRGN